MKIKLFLLELLPIVIACNSTPKTDNYFNFPVQEIELPEIGTKIKPEKIPELFSGFSGFWIEDSLFVGSLPILSDEVIMVGDILSNKELGRFGKRGRGPQDFLSPVSFDLHDGHIFIFDIMTSKVYDLDLDRSIKENSSIFTDVYTIEKGDDTYMPITAIHCMNGRLLAYNTGNDPMSEDLYSIPDYVEFDLGSGKQIKEYSLFKDIPSQNKKREHGYVGIKARMALTDCYLPKEGLICFVMKYIPQLNIFNPESGEARGFRIKELSENSLTPSYIHYNSVCSYGNSIYALYIGEMINVANQGIINTELHVYDMKGYIKQRIPLDGTYVDCRASESGLYLSKAQDGGADVGLYRINWDALQ